MVSKSLYTTYTFYTTNTINTMKKKTITIKDEQEEWLNNNHINLSRLVQDLLEKEMEK